MTLWHSADLNNVVSAVSSLFDETDGWKVVKSVSLLILLDVRHFQNAVEVLQKEEIHPWTDNGHPPLPFT